MTLVRLAFWTGVWNFAVTLLCAFTHDIGLAFLAGTLTVISWFIWLWLIEHDRTA